MPVEDRAELVRQRKADVMRALLSWYGHETRTLFPVAEAMGALMALDPTTAELGV